MFFCNQPAGTCRSCTQCLLHILNMPDDQVGQNGIRMRLAKPLSPSHPSLPLINALHMRFDQNTCLWTFVARTGSLVRSRSMPVAFASMHGMEYRMMVEGGNSLTMHARGVLQ